MPESLTYGIPGCLQRPHYDCSTSHNSMHSPFAPGHQAPQSCLFRDPSQAFVYTGEHSGESSIPVLPNPTLLSGVSDGNATSPSKPSWFYHPHVILSISLVGLTPLTPGFIFPSRRPTPGGQGPCLIPQLPGLELVLGRVCE